MARHFSFEGKRVTVFGLGVLGGGVGTVEFLVRHGVSQICVTDAKSREELADSVSKIEHLPGIRLSLGGQDIADFTHTDLVVKNPRIPWTNEYIVAAIEAGVPVEMDSSLFFMSCEKPIIGVTGTKGKTTTASAIAHILRLGGKRVLEVGIGEAPVLSLVGEASRSDIVVFELSSWRLSALSHIRKSPHISVFTNFYRDHLNYYSSLDEYFSDKENIVKFQESNDFFVYNSDSSRIVRAAEGARSRLIPCASKDHGVDGAFLRDGDIVFREHGNESVIVPRRSIQVPGEFMVMNLSLAAAAARAAGESVQCILQGISSFTGVPHRIERVARVGEVTWFNDSAATIPDATVASVRSMSCPVVLIAGGSDKNLDFDDLGREIAHSSHIRGVILLDGTATQKLADAVRLYHGEEKILGVVQSMERAISLASQTADPGSAVLLSPAAASFGMFRNEFDRGDQFRSIVRSL